MSAISPQAAKPATGKRPSAAARAEYRGICSTCIYAPTCAHRLRSPEVAVYECDLFEGYEAPRLLEAIETHAGQRGAVIAMLEEIQGKYGYLPPGALEVVAEKTGTSLLDIYGVATFYKHFSLQPRGEHLVSVCLGTACHVRGGPSVVKEFERQLGVAAGETTPDREITLETVACLGACALGPIVVVDGQYFSHVAPSGVKRILKRTREGAEAADVKTDRRIFPVEVNCPRCNHSLMDAGFEIDDQPSIRVTAAFDSRHGWLRLSSLYGSYGVESEYEVPNDAVVNFFCPHCHAELRGAAACPECGAPMVSLLVRRGGVIQICSRRGCKCHMLDVNGVNL